MKARDDAARHRIEVLRSIGRLPSDWQAWVQHGDGVALVRRFLEVPRRHNVDDAAMTELSAVIDEPHFDRVPPSTRACGEDLCRRGARSCRAEAPVLGVV